MANNNTIKLISLVSCLSSTNQERKTVFLYAMLSPIKCSPPSLDPLNKCLRIKLFFFVANNIVWSTLISQFARLLHQQDKLCPLNTVFVMFLWHSSLRDIFYQREYLISLILSSSTGHRVDGHWIKKFLTTVFAFLGTGRWFLGL